MQKYRLPGQSCVRRSRYGAQCRVRCVVARHSPSEPNGFKTEFVQFLRDRLSIMSSLLAISRYLSYIRLAFSFLSHMTPRLWQDWIAMPVCPSFRREGGWKFSSSLGEVSELFGLESIPGHFRLASGTTERRSPG